MKLTAPCDIARMIRRAPSGISRSALVAPSKGGTSGHSVLTVPAFLSPPRRSASLQESPTPRTRARARIEPVTLILASKLFSNDGFDLTGLQQRDNPVAPVPYTIFGPPGFISFDFSSSSQQNHGFATLTSSHSWSTRRNGIAGGARVRG